MAQCWCGNWTVRRGEVGDSDEKNRTGEEKGFQHIPAPTTYEAAICCLCFLVLLIRGQACQAPVLSCRRTGYRRGRGGRGLEFLVCAPLRARAHVIGRLPAQLTPTRSG